MNISRVLCVAFLIIYTGNVSGQVFSWATTSEDSGTTRSTSMALDANKNIFVVGSLNGPAKFGVYKINGAGSFFTKFNNQGQALWSEALNGLNCKSVSADISGHTFVCGSFSGKVQLGKFNLTSQGGNDFFVAKFDTLGNVLWARQGGGQGNDMALAVTNDLVGNTYITGRFEDNINIDSQTSLVSLGQGDAFLIQYDSSGMVNWAINEGGSDDDGGLAVATDLTGNVYMAGKFSGTVDFYRQEAISHGGYDVFIAKYTTNGLRLGQVVAGGAGDDIPSGIGLDGSAEIFITGTFNGSADFGGRLITSTKNDAFLAFYNDKMQPKWVLNIGGPNNDAATGVSVDGESNAFVTGVFSGTANFQGDSMTSSGKNDIFIAKYDAGGRLLWTEDVGGTLSDSTFAISVDPDDIAYLTGDIQGQTKFGRINLNGNSSGSFFLAKMEEDPTLGINPVYSQDHNIIIYPNPSSGIYTINSKESLSEIKQLTITDLTGHVIETRFADNSNSSTIDLTNQQPGIYFLRVLSDDGSFFVEKLVRM